MRETKNLKPLQIDGNYSFSQRYFNTQAKKKIQFLKYVKENEDISFSKFLNSLNLDEKIYIKRLKSKLTNPHFFKTNS